MSSANTDLLKELQLFQGIVERKNTIPILANVLFEAKGDSVRLAATDLEVGAAQPSARRRSPRPGALTLPAKKLFEIVKELPDTDIRIEEEKNGAVKVAADRFEAPDADDAEGRLPDAAGPGGRRGRRDQPQGPARDGREDAVRHHGRGHALLPERRAVRACATTR
ncbi:MAG: hypothetical protein M0C28_46640 [Candidatus Moduliflexus flocculans]|nr:hypothetical protein [Candidatus Moduliflexus flocculans]